MEKDILLDIVDNPDNYTKDELYYAFLEIAEQYLDELISNLNYERDIIAKLGKEKGNNEIERISMSNPALEDLEMENAKEDDPRNVIHNLIDFTDGEFGFDVGDS